MYVHTSFCNGQLWPAKRKPGTFRILWKSKNQARSPKDVVVLSAVSLWVGFQKQLIECQLYFWILKSYQHGMRIDGERDSRPKHIQLGQERSWKILHVSASTCVCVCASAHRKLNVRTCLEAKNLRSDVSFVQGLLECTLNIYGLLALTQLAVSNTCIPYKQF